MRRKKENMWNQVQRFSIRKFSFGVTSALIGTFFLANASMVQAEVESGTDSALHTTKPEDKIGTGKPNENAQPVVAIEDKKVETNVVAEKTEKASKEQATDVAAPKADKSTLSQAIDTLSELLNQVNLKKVSRTSMLEYEGVLSKAKEVFQNEAATQIEVDGQVVKVNSAISIAKSFPKVKPSTGETVAPKKVSDETLETPKTVTEIKHSLETVKEDLQKYVKKSEITTDKPNVTAAEKILENISKQLENTTLTSKELTTLLEQAKTVRNTLVNEELRANSGARDSRNNQSMGEGVNFRANGVPVEGALYDVKEYISQDKYNGGGTTTGQRVRTIEKTFMTAKYSKEGNQKYITYDVYFQNDGQALDGNTGNAFWFYPPRDLLYQGNSYPVGVVSDAYYERYQKNAGATGTLSENPNNFTQVGGRYTVPLIAGKYQDDGSQRLWPGAGGLFQFDGGPARRSPSQVQSMLKNLKDNTELNSIIRLGNNPTGNLPDGSYSHILNVSPKQNYAYKYHVKMRLRDDVTDEQAKKAGTIAVTTKAGSATEATQAYVYAARGTRLVTKPDAQIDPIQGLTVTKTVGDTLGDPNDPANSGYVRHKENKSFPGGMTWSWQGDVKPTSTAKAGVFKYKVIARYQDGTTSEDKGSGSDGTVTLIVRPTAPTITTAPQYSGTLVSTDRVISGTGAAGATIKVTLQDGSTGTTTVNNQGKWTYTLKANEKLTQNTKQDATIKADNAISVTQTQNGAESEASTVNVQLAKAISIDTPVQAGREITVKAAHDTGRFYVQVYNKNTDQRAAYEYSVKQENGHWVLESGSDKSDLIVADGDNVSEKKFTLRIKDANKKTNFPFKITANSVVKVRSHHVNGKNNPADPSNDGGWITASPATNTPPTITFKAPKTAYTADGSLTMAGLKNLVTVADVEDDADKTVGNRVGDNFNLTIKKGNQVVNLANNEYLKKGDYTLTYTTTDAAGVPVRTERTITVNYAAVAKPTINLIQGETLTDAEKRSLLQLQDGTSKIDVPSDARVEVTLDTSSESNGRTASATVVFADNTRTAPININYKVYKNFETVTKVYDFAGVDRNDSPSSYYKNPGGLPGGMSWVFKKGNGTLGTADNNKLKESLNADGVGTTTYSFGAKYPRGRFTDNPSEAEKLSYTPTFTHEVFDVIAFNNPQTQKNRVEVNNGETLSAAQAASAVVKTPSSQALPAGTTYEWVKSATDATPLTDAEKNVTEFGEITRYVKVTLPKVSEDGPSANRVQPYKIIPVTLKVNETVKPTVQMDGRRLTTNAEDNKFVIFRGATFNPTFTVNDNSGKISTMEVSGLPSGTNFIKNTETANGDVQLSGNVTATANATLGTNNVGSVKVTDARGNTETYKFKYVVVDVEVKNTPETVDKGTKLFVPNNTRESKDSHNYVKVVATPNTDGSDVYYPGGMNFKWSKNNAEITNETVFDTPGTITYNAVVKFPNAKSNKNNVDIDGDGRNENVTIYAPDKIERTVTFKVKPTAPIVTAKDNGDVEITPTNQTNVDKVSVTFTPQEGTNPAEVTYTAKKNDSGVWEFGSGVPLTVDPTTGIFKLKDRKVKDGTTVTAKALTTDGTGSIQSNPATGIAGNGDAVLPEIEFKNTETDAQGNRVVYITPTEDTNLDVATITDNSNKLLEAVFFDQGTTLTDLGNYGLTYNKVIRNGDTITTAPLTFTVRGTLNKIKSGSTLWADDEVIVTRYASAMDAAENNIKDKSGSRDNVASNPYRVVFKTLTQATKYTPTVSKSKIERDITQANTIITATEFNKIKDTLTFSSTRGEVKVNKNTSGLTFAMKNSTVQTKQDGTLYITATVTYPDGSREDIEVPLDTTNANKAKPTLTIPEVSVKAAKAKNEQGSVPATEYNRVLNNVTVPQGQPQPTTKEVKNNGRISVVDGKNVVTVGLTFSDNTTKDVTVPVLEVKPIDITTAFNEKDNTVTVKPNTTVENGDKLHVTIRGVGMQLTKTATGYTNSRNDRNITVNSDGSITINLLGNETFQAGDRVVTRHESNKNGKVDSYETEAFAGLKPVEKVPAINLIALTNKEKEDVKAAVKKANPSVNTAELEVAANGDVIYRHKGAGVGTSDPTPVITLSQTVRERNDAEKIDPTIATLKRYVKETKHTDEQIKNAITGEHIANKVITGEIPTNGGTVVVKVTYTDGSSENVKVPIIVTPELTPVKNLSNLTNNEKESVKDKIQALNPTATNIVVKNNGETTLTIPDVTTATLTPDKTVVEAQSNAIADPAKTPVVKLTELTTEEKEKVKAEIKKVNPNAKTVEVSENGTATVTFNDGTTATLTPDKTVVEAQSNAIADPAKTPVVKLTELTTEEKEKVKAEIKKVNPNAKTVEVSENGTATVTFNDGTTATLTPDKTVVEAQSNAIADPAKTPVVKLTELTTEEKEKVKAEIKKVNPNAKTVEVSENGTATVTFNDGTTATLTPDKTVVEAQSNAIADPAKTPVVKLTELTTEEKEKVKAEIKKVNPNAKTVEVSENGTATVTFNDGTTATLTPDKTVVEAQSNAIADPAKTPVVKLTELTTEEKEKVKAEIKKVNPNAKTVEVSENGTATVTFNDGTTATLTPDKTVVEAQSNAIADPAKTPVVKLTELTTEEKEKVKAEIKKVNPNAKTVEVSENGTATVTFNDGTTATLTPDKTVVEAQSNAIADPAKTPVVKLTELTTEEKEKVKAEIKKVNPNAKTVEVSENGTATVTFNDGTTATLTPDKTVVEAQSNAIADPAKTPVVKLTELTTEEKEKVKAEIKKVNPNAKTVEVSENGTATVTFNDGTTATLTPDKTVVEAQSNAIADPAKTPVVKLTELTTEEKEKVKAEIKKVNPNAKTVEVSENGTATVTFNDGTTATLTPDKTVVEAQSNAIADPAKTPVVKLTELTTEEKEKVKAEIKKVNPNAKTVEVSENGTATVTFNDGTTATLTPDKTVVEAQSNAIADPAKTPVVKLTELTTEEKEKVKAEIKKVNPNAKTVEVSENGTATVTFNDGTTATLTPDKTVVEAQSNAIADPAKTPVVKLTELTTEEKEKVKAEIKKVNPNAKTVEVSENGTATVTFNDGTTATLTPDKTVVEAQSNAIADPAKTPVVKLTELTTEEKEKVKAEIKKVNPNAKTVEVSENGTATVTFNDGTTATLTPDKTVVEAQSNAIADPAKTPVVKLTELTTEEKEKVKAEIKKVNPNAKTVEVSENGTATVTFNDGTTATLTPDKTVVEAQSNAIADPAKTPVVKLTELTTEEKEKVKAEIKKVNPNAKTVEVSENGTATVTFNDGTTATLTPDKTVVEAQSNAIADPAKTPVVKLTELTTEEKEKVKAEIKKVNPNAKTVEVSENGTATVTFNDGTTATLTPDKTVVEAQSNAIADPAKTPVVKLTELTTEEKEKVKAEIKKVNPNAKTVEVSENGTATVTFNDGTTATLTPDKTVVEAQSNAIADPAKTPVVKLTELTTEEKEKVKAEIKKVNPNAKTVEVSENGTATVTFNDGTTATLTPDKTVVEAQSNAIADPAKTPVVKLTELTTEEKEKVKAEIKKVNPNAKTVEVSENGTATVTFNDGTTATLTPDKTVVEAQSNAIADPAKTPVVKLTELTTEEKEKVKAEIKKVNPNAKTVEVSENGTATVTFNDGTTATLTPDKTVVEAQSNAIADPAKTPVVKLTELTTEEKEKVKAEIKKVNPNAKTVEVSENGTATVTFNDGTTATLTPDKTVVEAQSNAIADPAKTPVVKLTELTTEEKEKVKAEIKKVNPNAKTVEVSENGTATVTFNDGTTATLTPDKTVVEAQSNAIADPAKTPVVKLTELTTEEKEKVKAEIKKVNPNAKTVEVSENGTATVTFNDGTTATLTPDKTVVEAQSNAIADPAKTPVVKLTELTTEEKEKVKAEIKKVNPNAKTVEVSENGTATVTFNDGTTATLTPDKTVVEAQSNAIADPAKTPVVKLTELTTEEKEKVKAEIKKVNPNAKTVEVSENGTATVTFNDGTTATLTPDKTVVEAQSNAIADPAKTPVVKLTELTTEEKEKVKAEIKKVNPNAKTVEVSENGTATVTFNDGTTATLTPDKTVVEAQSNAIADPAKTPVVKLTELTTEEKEKVKAEIKKVNPNAKTVEVSENGTATVTFNDGTTATLTPDKTVVEAQSNAIADPAKTPVVKLTELTTEEKEKVKAEIKKVNPNAKTVEVSENGTATVTFNDGTTATLTPDKTVVEAQSNAIADPAKTPVVKLTELTTEEKEKVKAEIKKVNPNAKTVEVSENGTATVTFNDGTTATLTPDKTVVEAQSNAIADPAKTPVVKLTELTTEEKEKVKAEIKKVNPNAKTVEVSENGTATVTFNDGTTATLTPDKTVVEAQSNAIADPAKTPVVKLTELTTEEKEKVKAEIKKVNPNAKTVEVSENGTATVTFNDGTTATLTPDKTVVEAQSNAIADPAKTPVVKLTELTTAEKEKVKAEIKKVNPNAKTVEVSENGTATVTFNDGTTATLTPDKTVVEAQSNAIADPAKTPVVKLTELTTEEKEKVKAEIKKVNPNAKTVEVSENGTATVTFNDGTTATLTPDKTVVEAQSNAIADPAKTPVVKLTELTTAEKEKVKAEIKKVNPNAKTVEVSENGTATVTFNDGTTATLTPDKTVVEAQSNAIADPAKTPVVKLTELTTAEKEKVKAEIKKVNPNAKTVEVSDNGTATVTFKDDTTATLTPDKTVVEAQSNAIADPAKTPVVKLTELTTEEKEKVKAEIKKVNPNAKTVEVSENGTATVTFKDDTTATLTPDKTVVEAQSNAIADPAKTPVVKLTELTTEEKEKVKAEIKKVNPNAKTVEVSENGTATVTFNDGTTATLTPDKTVVEAQSNAIADPAKTPVVKLTELTTAEKEKVKAEIKKVNPNAKTVEVSDNGTATVTFNDGTTATLIPDKTVVEAQSNAIADPAKTPVVKLTELTTEEKEKVKAEIKKVNPNAKTVEVSDNGTATVTFNDDTTATLTPDKTVVEDFTPVKPTEKVPVKDKAHLTPEEKKQVADKVKDKNPGKEVTVGDDGTATVTDPTTGISHTIPGTDLVNQDFEPVKPDEKVPVKDKAHLTPEEKKQVADKVKDKNPDKEVTVGDDGTATVTDPTTGISHTIPGTDLVNQDFEPVKPTEKVPVKDKAHLTPEEKKQVADKVKDKNPGKEVTVGDDGTATVTDPTTGISHTIPGTDLVNQDFEPVKPDEKVPVKDKAHLTPEEKKQVADKVKDKNPGKEVTVGDDGTATVTDPTTGISHTIPGTDLVNQDFEPVKPDEKVPVKDKAHLTPEEKKQVANKVKDKNPGKEVTVGDDGTATVTDPTTGISHTIPGTDLVNQDFEPVKPDEKVPVKDKAHLTPEEKKQVADKVKDKNPGKEVTVGDDGTVTVTDPTTGISHTIPGIDLTIIVPPVVDIPEFNGAVNGELPDPVELPKVKLIITKWIDEQGNELKPADAKAPAVVGEANEAFEHGEIEGYVFVRTDVNKEGDVVTHVFRKVTPTKPEGNGGQHGGDNKPQSTPGAPTDNTERKPEVVTPDEQPAETENTTTKPKASQNILPNTGTAKGLGIFSAAAASILSGLGLVVFGKKEDEEEDETQNNESIQ